MHAQGGGQWLYMILFGVPGISVACCVEYTCIVHFVSLCALGRFHIWMLENVSLSAAEPFCGRGLPEHQGRY